MTQHAFTGTLGVEDMARHIPHAFEVPQGTRCVRVAFDHAPEHPGIGPLPHQLSISVYGPSGARGTRHCNADQSPVISENWASPGYTPGSIEPGTWLVELDTHRILPPGNISYRLTVDLDPDPTEGPVAPPPGVTQDRGPGWYRGDLHGHSHHSDARWPVADFIAHARSRGLDFVTLTDHNTVSGLPEAQALAADDLLVMGGIELTTFHGHCLTLGARAWVDWRIKDGQTMADRARQIIDSGQTYVIAHPMAMGHPWCTGCHWAYADVYPGPARLVEIWNSDWGDSANDLALTLFQTWLNKGLRMRATAGTDIHGPLAPEARVGYNTVLADALTKPAILEAVRAGRNVLSSGPGLEVTLRTSGEPVPVGGMSGDVVGTVLEIAITEVPDGATCLVQTGGPGGTQTLKTVAVPDGAFKTDLALPDMPARSWVMVLLRCAGGQMLALSNPIFFPGDWG